MPHETYLPALASLSETSKTRSYNVRIKLEIYSKMRVFYGALEKSQGIDYFVGNAEGWMGNMMIFRFFFINSKIDFYAQEATFHAHRSISHTKHDFLN